MAKRGKKKLANINTKDIPQKKLTKFTSTPFIVSFKYPLQKGYKFSDMQLNDMNDFQRFLDRISEMTFDQVEKSYRRESDKEDKFKDRQVIHYGYSGNARIHGVIEEGRFKVIRIDPNHKFHNT